MEVAAGGAAKHCNECVLTELGDLGDRFDPELPELARGQGVTLQRYRDGGLSDALAFQLSEGLSWALGGESGRMRTETDLTPWRAARGAAGRMPPMGFPRTNRFG